VKTVADDITGKQLKGSYCEVSITVHVVEDGGRYRAGNVTLDISKKDTTEFLEQLGVEIDLEPRPVTTDEEGAVGDGVTQAG